MRLSSFVDLGATASSSLLDTLMPTEQNYDENGLLRTTTDQNERLTSFDSFMQSLDNEYDKRKQLKNKTVEKKPVEKKTTTDEPKQPAALLTLDGPIEYRDKKSKKKLSPTKKSKVKKPVIKSSSSSDNEEMEQSNMVYDEDNAW